MKPKKRSVDFPLHKYTDEQLLEAFRLWKAEQRDGFYRNAVFIDKDWVSKRIQDIRHEMEYRGWIMGEVPHPPQPEGKETAAGR